MMAHNQPQGEDPLPDFNEGQSPLPSPILNISKRQSRTCPQGPGGEIGEMTGSPSGSEQLSGKNVSSSGQSPQVAYNQGNIKAATLAKIPKTIQKGTATARAKRTEKERTADLTHEPKISETFRRDVAKVVRKLERGQEGSQTHILNLRWQLLHKTMYTMRDGRHKVCALHIRYHPADQLLEVSLNDAKTKALVFRMQEPNVVFLTRPSSALIPKLWTQAVSSPLNKADANGGVVADCTKFFALVKETTQKVHKTASQPSSPQAINKAQLEDELTPLGQRLGIDLPEDDTVPKADKEQEAVPFTMLCQHGLCERLESIPVHDQHVEPKVKQGIQCDIKYKTKNKHVVTEDARVDCNTLDIKPLGNKGVYKGARSDSEEEHQLEV